MKYLITGVVASGKSSVRHVLEQRGYAGLELDDPEICNWYHNFTGAIGIYVPGTSKEWLSQYSWLADKKRLAERISVAGDIFVSGVPSNTTDIVDLFDNIFLLQISDYTIRKRLIGRTEASAFGKSEDEVLDVYRWKPGFDVSMMQRGAIPIDAERSLSEVVDDILLRIR